MEASWASSFKLRAKLRYKSNFQCTSLHRRVCWSCFVARYVSLKGVSVRLFTVKTLSFPLKSNLEFVLYRGKPKLLVCWLNSLPTNQNFRFVLRLACVEDIWKGGESELLRRERNTRGARGGREGNACQETIVFLVFNIHQANVKILIGQSSKHVNHSPNIFIHWLTTSRYWVT